MSFPWWPYLILIVASIPLIYFDIRSQILPDIILYPAALLSFAGQIFIHKTPLPELFIRIAAGFMFFFIIFLLRKGKLGGGDIKLSSFICLSVGLYYWWISIIFASFTGLIYAGIMFVGKRLTKNTKLPFGPFLLGAALIVIGADILNIV